MYTPSGRPTWVCLLSEQIWITLLAYQWSHCSGWVPSEWESKTADKIKITIIDNPQLQSLLNLKPLLAAVWTLILTAPIHQASDVMVNFSKSVLIKKQTHVGRPEDEYNFSIFFLIFLGELFLYAPVHCRLLLSGHFWWVSKVPYERVDGSAFLE